MKSQSGSSRNKKTAGSGGEPLGAVAGSGGGPLGMVAGSGGGPLGIVAAGGARRPRAAIAGSGGWPLGFRLGRLHRTYDARVPHLSALLAGQALQPPPPAVDWTKAMPSNLGMMLNNKLGDCTCAAVYHAKQVWTFNAGSAMVTQPDSDVEKLYILACGYNPRVPGEGPGGIEQKVLTYWLNHGVPIGPAGAQREKIAAFVEVDPRNVDDVKRTINDCGVAYIGFNVPQSVMPPNQPPPSVWNYVPNDSNIIGGHAVVLAGYDDSGAKVISWGQYYTMTWEFFAHFVDEVYAIADVEWIKNIGTSPGGLTLDELEAQMNGLKGS
jgi:hypothetical protein